MAEFKRKLASIQIIDALNPIEGADRIEIAQISGWRVIVKKGDFKVGDKCIYVEVDSILPDIPAFEFMRDKKFRVKTMKMRGQVSQGICFPTSILKNGDRYAVDAEVTHFIGNGIKKYETDKWNQSVYNPTKKEKGFYRGVVKPFFYNVLFSIIGKVDTLGEWPKLFPHTDEPRIQHIVKILEKKYVGTRAYVTEKMHGCFHYNMRVTTDRGSIKIGKIVNQKLPVKVLTYNEKTKIVEYKSIVKFHKYERKLGFLKVTIESRKRGNRAKSIICTPNHNFFTDRGWVEAQNLNINDVVYHLYDSLSSKYKDSPCVWEGVTFGSGVDIRPNKIISISPTLDDDDRHNLYQYDLEVEDNHNYFVYNTLVHNSSMSVFKNGSKFGVCSRNYELLLYNVEELSVWRKAIAKWIAKKMNLKVVDQSNTHFWKTAIALDLKSKLDKLGRNIALQGEICGPGINENMYNFEDYRYFVFSAWDIDQQRYLCYEEMFEILKTLSLEPVPLLDNDFAIHADVDKWTEYSEAKSVFGCGREGIVVRPYYEVNDPNVGRLSFKVISPTFLLSEK